MEPLDEHAMAAALGDLLARSAAANDCTVAEFVDRMFVYLGVPARADQFTDIINSVLRASMHSDGVDEWNRADDESPVRGRRATEAQQADRDDPRPLLPPGRLAREHRAVPAVGHYDGSIDMWHAVVQAHLVDDPSTDGG